MLPNYEHDGSAKLPPLRSLPTYEPPSSARGGQSTGQRGTGRIGGPHLPARVLNFSSDSGPRTTQYVPPPRQEWVDGRLEQPSTRGEEAGQLITRYSNIIPEGSNTPQYYAPSHNPGDSQRGAEDNGGNSTPSGQASHVKVHAYTPPSAGQPHPAVTTTIRGAHYQYGMNVATSSAGTSRQAEFNPKSGGIAMHNRKPTPYLGVGNPQHSHPPVSSRRPQASAASADEFPTQTGITASSRFLSSISHGLSTNGPSGSKQRDPVHHPVVPVGEHPRIDGGSAAAGAEGCPRYLQELETAIRNSEWHHNQRPEPELKAGDPFVLCGLLQVGRSRFQAFVASDGETCLHCNKRLSRPSRALDHVRSQHFRYTPVKCPTAGCKSAFPGKDALKKHQREQKCGQKSSGCDDKDESNTRTTAGNRHGDAPPASNRPVQSRVANPSRVRNRTSNSTACPTTQPGTRSSSTQGTGLSRESTISGDEQPSPLHHNLEHTQAAPNQHTAARTTQDEMPNQASIQIAVSHEFRNLLEAEIIIDWRQRTITRLPQGGSGSGEPKPHAGMDAMELEYHDTGSGLSMSIRVNDRSHVPPSASGGPLGQPAMHPRVGTASKRKATADPSGRSAKKACRRSSVELVPKEEPTDARPNW